VTRAELRASVTRQAFDGNDAAEINRWLNQADAALWISEEWKWRYGTTHVTVTADSAAVTVVPDDFDIPLGMWRNTGERLTYLPPEDFFDVFWEANTTETGTPWAYTITNEALEVGPAAAETSVNYLLYYQSAYGHMDDGTDFSVGPMDADDDTPVFPEELHYILVYWARMIGKALRADPTAKLEEALRDEALEAMRKNWLVDKRGQYEQWGAFHPSGGTWI
jgi:hypothetical protein